MQIFVSNHQSGVHICCALDTGMLSAHSSNSWVSCFYIEPSFVSKWNLFLTQDLGLSFQNIFELPHRHRP